MEEIERAIQSIPQITDPATVAMWAIIIIAIICAIGASR